MLQARLQFTVGLRSFVSCLLLLAPISAISFGEQAQPNRSPLTLPERESLARPLLEHAEEVANSFDPGFRSLVQYRTAGAWVALDPGRAVRVYRSSFLSAMEAPLAFREHLESVILNDLLPLSPTDVLDLLPAAELTTRSHLYVSLIKYLLVQGDYPKAVSAFDSGIANGVLSKEATTHLLASLPNSLSAERAHVFSESIRFCQLFPDEKPLSQPYEALAYLMARFYSQMSPALVMRGIDAALSQAEQEDHDHPAGRISRISGSNYLEFQSNYDFALFAVAPVLQELNRGRVAELLEQHPEAVDALKHFPQGLASFASHDFSFNYAIAPRRDKPPDLCLWSNLVDPLNLLPQDIGLEFTAPRTPLPVVTGSGFYIEDPKGPEVPVLARFKDCPLDLADHVDLFHTVPVLRKIPFICDGPMIVSGQGEGSEAGSGQWCTYTNTYPRANLIQFVTQGCINLDHPAQARAAIHEELGILPQIPEENRLGHLQMAADLFLRLGDLNSAAEVTGQGFTLARATYERELSADNLQKFPKGFWRSAEIYREMITLGVNASLDRTRKTLDDIPDPRLRELEEVMLARALVGVPVRRSITVDPAGNLAVSQGITYEGSVW